jgi:hypothetical protein
MFSKRLGLEPPQMLQLSSMDERLSRGLWNVIHGFFDSRISRGIGGYNGDGASWRLGNVAGLIKRIWGEFFGLCLDELPSSPKITLDKIRALYFSELDWYKKYDLIEYLVQQIDPDRRQEQSNFIANCNKILEQENSAYRFANKILVAATSPYEIYSIENASKTHLDVVNSHIEKATHHLSNRTPDYRNSIKESISAIEALVRIVMGEPKKTLSELLKKKELNLHPALQNGLAKIYEYTNDESGIRHSLIEDGRDILYSDALFMLVICSAFINYILCKEDEQ